jgi:dephospho-CoA kinase
METIGVVGGVASGKSVVTRMFESLGAVRIDADQVGHLVLEEPRVRSALVARWGQRIVGEQGELDRREISRIVFGQDEGAAAELRFLEQITHPRIESRLKAQLAHAEARGAPAAVLDAAVMIKAGWDRLCSRLVFVKVPRAERLRRALQRGWTAEQFVAREAAQTPLERKRQQAETIIDNSGTLEETLDQVKAVWSTWKVDRD